MSYLTEAFKQMELLESEQFSFDKDGAAKLANFLDDDMLNDFEAIIDPEAETKEELKDSYMGNVICRCPICRSLIYRDPEEIKVDEEEQLANLEEPCPYCFEHGGFEIVGQVAPYEEVTVEAKEGTKVEVDGQEVDTDPKTEEDKVSEEESLTEGTIYDKLVKAFPELADEASFDVRARRHTRDNEDIEDSQRFPVEGTKQRNLVERRCAKRRHSRDNEDLEDSQRYPIESPVGTKGLRENKETANPGESNDIHGLRHQEGGKQQERKSGKSATQEFKLNKDGELELGDVDERAYADQLNSSSTKNNTNKSKRHARDNEDLEDSQRYPIESPAPAQTGLREAKDNSEKGLTDSAAELVMNDKGEIYFDIVKDQDSILQGKENLSTFGYKIVNVRRKDKLCPALMNTKTKKLVEVPNDLDLNDHEAVLAYVKTISNSKNLKEGMEDISITTDDQVIKVKATPRADKETIQPVEDETKDVIESPEMEEETPVEDMPIENQDVEIEEFDEESFDNLGESYLRQVYENVSGFKTSNVQSITNKIIVEGIISFNSGKKVKTKFMFEAKDATKSGKLRFTGLNENISKNKKAFTLTGILKENKLISESLNYNYSAQAENGKSKRLYGTIRR